MNPGLIVSLVASGAMKKQLAAVFAAMVVTLALPFIAVASMGKDVVTFLAATPSAQSAETQGFYTGGPVPGDSYAWGNCTYWAYAMRLAAHDPIPTTWGNANTWAERAALQGYVVDHTPAVGAVFQTTEGDFGHVAYVTSVDPSSGRWTISEMNAPHLNVVDTRTFAPSAAAYYNFIHDKKAGTS